MGTAGVSSSLPGRCAAPTSRRIHLQQRDICRFRSLLGYRRRLQGKLYAPLRLSCVATGRISVVRIRRVSFGAVGLWRCSLDEGGLEFKGVRTAAVRAQEGDKEEHQELDKVEDKPCESWTSSVQRANMVSRIFMATFVWISLFFGISVANNEIGGGRPGRRGPRK